MKIYFVIGDLSGGGAERAVILLANELVKRKNEVAIVCMPNNNKSYPIDSRVNIIRLRKYNNKFKDFFIRSMNLRKVFFHNKPDVIISFTTQKNVCTIMSTIFTKSNLIISERNDPNQDPKSKLLRFLRKILYRFADGYVFQTEDAKKYFSKSIQRKSIIIPNPMNMYLPKPYVGERKKKIVTVARLEPEKNIIMAIKVFQKIKDKYPEYKLYIYGEGSDRPVIEQYIQSNNLANDVYLEGFVSNVSEKIKDAAAFIFPSNYEGISNALMEALAIGIPCVSTDHPIGGAKLLIKDGYNGFLVPVEDINSMVNKLQIILSNNELSNKISNNAVNYINDNFNIDKIVNQWEKYFKKIKYESEKK